jgi:feruloyl esterase
MKKVVLLVVVIAISCLGGKAAALDSVRALVLPGVAFPVVEVVSESGSVPSYVRVAAVARPSDESNIRIEVWMPERGWNKRFIGGGNGGGGGGIDYNLLKTGITMGYAIAHTDMGTSAGVDQLEGKPGVWEDFGYRATHEMTVVAKAVIKAYYGVDPAYSYFYGCSTGGQQAMMEAQRYPEDYNGILAGAPANNRTHLHTMFLWNNQLGLKYPQHRFTQQQARTVTEAVIAGNVGKDGGCPDDGFLTDPRLATFRPEVLEGVLSPGQIELLKQIYAGPVNPATGEQIYTSLPLGGESSGNGLYEQTGEGIRYHLYPFRWVYGVDYDYTRFDFNRDMDDTDAKLASLLNANDPNLEPFRAAGGKLIIYHGTADAIVPMQDAVNYYERVIINEQGSLEQTQTFFRLFLVPGMDHCGGGAGPSAIGQGIASPSEDSQYNIFAALIKWVEAGTAPKEVIGTGVKNNTQFQRPIFPYPQFPHYIEGQDPLLPTSYQAVTHERGRVLVPAARYY